MSSEPESQRINPTSGADDSDQPTQDEGAEERKDIPVVGIAASAGGLKAFRDLLPHLPVVQHMAYVLIQHLDPDHESLIAQLLAKGSSLTISEAFDGVQIEPQHVYVIPPGQELHLLGNKLLCFPRKDDLKLFHPADTFFQSLAEDRGAAAIGVVLSGTGSDGTAGLCAIKAAGGITFAQTPDSAEYDGMPSSSISSGCVDFERSIEEIGRELTRISHRPERAAPIYSDKEQIAFHASPEQLNKIFVLLRSRTGHDFSFYKPNTIKRRISRRMMVHKLDRISEYILLLQKDSGEVDRLYHDILINVTAFFRDSESYEGLVKIALPDLLKNRPEGAPIRIWVPGCSTGEEVYSIAISLHEQLGDRAGLYQLQIFGSDIDDVAIEKARAGLYPESIAAQVSQVRLKRYFQRVTGGYQVKTTIRDNCIFALQNVVRDPPFSRVDLVSCRNLLIYLGAVLQKKVLQIFHYALQPQGYLLLGTSETIGSHAELFELKDKRAKLYKKKAVASRVSYDNLFQPHYHAPDQAQPGPASEFSGYDMDKDAQAALMDHYAPPGVIINPDQVVLKFLGRTWPYIEQGDGSPSLNLYKIAHPDLIVELRAALHTCSKDGKPVRKERVRIKVDKQEQRVDIQVIPLSGPIQEERNLLVMFEPRPDSANDIAQADLELPSDVENMVTDMAARNQELEREISSTREYMQSIVEEQEGTNEELRSANEEIQSTNEELQSTNEELETAKEELQSTNEELATVNEELETRNDELARANDDLSNLLTSVNLPILMLDANLRIRQFTHAGERLLNLIDSDLGRPIGNIKPNIEVPDLESQVLQVIDQIDSRTFEAQDNQGHWYSVRMRPYKTQENRIDGAVMTFIEIDSLKDKQRLESELFRERHLAAVVRNSNDAITVQDLKGNIQAWNPAAERIYGYTEEEACKMNVRELVFEEDWPVVNEMIQGPEKGGALMPLEIRRRAKNGTVLRIWLVASVLVDEQHRPIALATTEKLL